MINTLLLIKLLNEMTKLKSIDNEI